MTTLPPFAAVPSGLCSIQIPGCTPDELWYTVICRARDYGWPLDPAKHTLLERLRDEIDASPMYGTGRVRHDPDRAVLGELARRAVAWLNTLPLDGRRFVLSDGLYLLDAGQPDSAATSPLPPSWRRSPAA